MKTVKILLTLVAFLFLAKPAEAALLQDVKLSIADPTQANSSPTQHKVTATIQSRSTAMKTIQMQYCTRASSDTENVAGGCDIPDGLGAATPTTGDSGDWANMGVFASWSATYAAGVFTLTYDVDNPTTFDQSTAGSAEATWEYGGITNANINATDDDKQCDIPGGAGNAATASSATCYVRIATKTSGGTSIDTAVVTYTVIRAIAITATVDPTFTFRVVGVNTGQAAAGETTTVSSAASTLPFGNLQAASVEYVAHQLFVTTNTENGYTVSAKLSADISGVYGGNIDPFTGVWTTGGAAWSSPNGSTPNTNTGWFGAHVEDATGNSKPSDADMFGGIGSATPVIVKDSTGADNGSTGHYVVYAMEVNVYQPADTYSGTLVYNALPTY